MQSQILSWSIRLNLILYVYQNVPAGRVLRCDTKFMKMSSNKVHKRHCPEIYGNDKALHCIRVELPDRIMPGRIGFNIWKSVYRIINISYSAVAVCVMVSEKFLLIKICCCGGTTIQHKWFRLWITVDIKVRCFAKFQRPNRGTYKMEEIYVSFLLSDKMLLSV